MASFHPSNPSYQTNAVLLPLDRERVDLLPFSESLTESKLKLPSSRAFQHHLPCLQRACRVHEFPGLGPVSLSALDVAGDSVPCVSFSPWW
jgi:hypothetical protein